MAMRLYLDALIVNQQYLYLTRFFLIKKYIIKAKCMHLAKKKQQNAFTKKT